MSWIAFLLILIVGAILFAAIIFSGRARGHGWVSYVARLLGGFLTASIIGTLAFILTLLIFTWGYDILGYPEYYKTNLFLVVVALGIAIITGVIAGVVGFVLTGRYLEKKEAEEASS